MSLRVAQRRSNPESPENSSLVLTPTSIGSPRTLKKRSFFPVSKGVLTVGEISGKRCPEACSRAALATPLVMGPMISGGSVDAPIGRHPTQRTKMAVIQHGKPARTHYRIVERFIDCTLVECALETGRTHQIRVHMTSIGHPLVGDQVYGTGTSRVPIGPTFARQALHARRLGLVHPASGKSMLWKSELSEDMAELVETARLLAFEARALAEEAEEDDWDEEDFADGPEIIYAYGDGSEDDDDLE